MLMPTAPRRNGTNRNVSRAGMAFIMLLAIWWVVAASEARADQISVEAAATAAGLAFETGAVTANGATIYYRDIGPRGEPLLLLHGFPETGDAFAQVVGPLGTRYRLIVPDLRGAGQSERAPSGYDKKTLANDVRALMDHLKIDRAHVIGHDIGARIAYAFAVQYPERLLSLTVAEAFIEGLAGTSEFKLAAPANPRTQHFARFAKVDESVSENQGKEEELILSFMNSRSKSRKFVSSDVTRYTESLKRDGGLRAAFMNYEALDRDAAFLASTDTSALSKTAVLAVACQSPFGNNLQRQLVATGLKQTKAVSLDGCAHWIYEENPSETLAVLTGFLDAAKFGP